MSSLFKENCNGSSLAASIRRTSLFLILSTILVSHGIAFAIDISDDPMDTKVQAAAPNIMFILDDSGSMDWEFMTEESNGLFSGKYYVFKDSDYDPSPDHNYGTGHALDASQRVKWKSQWAGYNKIYYDPHVTYMPWPGYDNADTTNPRSNPRDSSPTFDLAAEFFFIPGSGVEVIVDNQDSSPYFTTPAGSWSESSLTPEYDYSSFWSGNDGAQAVFTPNIPEQGTYDVSVWWNCYSYRDQSAKIIISHSGSDSPTVLYKNQRSSADNVPETGICGEWIDLGAYDFEAGLNGSVTIERDLSAPGDHGNSTVADAVKFSLQDSYVDDISVRNAHYFVWDDDNANEEVDAGEIYLVTWEDADGDGVLDVDPTGAVDHRKYFRFFDSNGNDEVESGELIPVDPADVPDSIRPKVYNEDGTVLRDQTDAEELQNFANWFSFYRRRELTSKAAVSNAIVNLERVNVGFYTINSSTQRQPVLPVKGETNAIIVDNLDSGFSTSGKWRESGWPEEYNDSCLYTKYVGDWAKWTPNVPADGDYIVYAWWNCYSNRDSNAKFTITYDGGEAVVYKDQGDADTCGEWVELGTYTFAEGTAGSIKVERHSGSTGTSTAADAVKLEPLSGSISADETDTLLDILYSINSSGYTPLRRALLNVGRYFDKDDGLDGNLGESPYASEEDGGGCQQSFAIVMTDGYWNGENPYVYNQDGDQGAPYADSYSDTLADVAMKFYKEDLADDLPDIVPTTSCDHAGHQHMVTYTVSFGVTGTLTPLDSDGDGEEDDPCFLNPDTPQPVWPNPYDGDREKIDDMWHAAVNGRGLFFSARNPQELVDSLTDLLQNLEARMASGASVSVNGEELNSGTTLYQATYQAGSWIGDVTAYPIDPVTGEIKKESDEILWTASEKLQLMDWDSDRKIISYNPSASSDPGITFRYDSFTDEQKAALGSDLVLGSDADLQAQNLVDYIRGKEISGFRSRVRKLGDIVHSAPLLTGDTLFVGGNDGMLHAFNASDGTERFAYVPSLLFSSLPELADVNYSHKFFVDLTPYAKSGIEVGDQTLTILVGGLGKGGKGYYALNITDADNVDGTQTEEELAEMALWEYPNASTPGSDGIDNDEDGTIDEAGESYLPGNTDPDLGFSFSRAFIVRSYATDHDWVVIFGNGYNSENGKAVLYVLDLLTGELIRKIDTEVGGDNGLSTPAAVDVDGDFYVDYVYAGDLKGNMWKFDLRSSDPADWAVAYNDGTSPKPLVTIPGQPITSKPDVMYHCEEHGYMVIFGTGKYLGETDRTDVTTQSIFGIWDYGDDDDDREYLGEFDRATGELSNQPSGVTLLEQTEIDFRVVNGTDLRTLSKNSADWTTEDDSTDQDANSANNLNLTDGIDNDNDGQIDEDLEQNPNPVANVGWFFDLPIEGERVVKQVIIRDGKAIVISFIPNSSPCAGGGKSIIHEMDACTGGRLGEAQFDISGDGQINEDDLITVTINGVEVQVAPTGMGRPGLLHPPVFLRMPDNEREMKIFSSSSGNTESIFENAEQLGVYYWIERD